VAQDDVQIKIGVVGNQDILNVSKSIDALSNKTKKLAKDFDSGRSTSQAYFKGLSQQASALKKLGFSYNESRKYVFDLAKAQRESAKHKMFESQAREAARFEDELQNVLRSINPLKNATDAYTQKLMVLNTALSNGTLDAKQHALALVDLKTQAQLSGLVFDKQGGIVQGSSKNMKMFNMQVQQAGYQIGDFFTQVQMGQNPLMAFSTQMSQLAGFFGGPWGAAVGAGIAILGALGVAFMASGAEAKTFEDSLSEVQSAISDLNGSLEVLNTPMYELIQDMGLAAFQAKEMHRNLAQLVELRALENISNTSGVLKQNLEGLVDQLAVIQSPSVQGKEGWAVLAREVRELESDFQVTVEQAVAINTALENLGKAKGPVQQAVAARQLADALMSARDDAGAVVGPLRAAAENALRLALEADKAAVATAAIRDSDPGSGWLNNAIMKASILAATLWDAAAGMAATGTDIQVDSSGNFPEGSRGRTKPRAAPSGIGGIDWGVDFGKSGGGSKKKEQEDYLASLLKEAEYKKSIIGLSEEESRRKEIIFELTEKGLPIEDARIKKVLEAEAALKKATEAEENRKNMIENISNKMEDAFMSMIDGSKSVGDAFKGMIREILLDIYRQQVAKPMASGLSSLLGGFLGGSGGGTGSFGLPMPYADGGVVSRASMFPMSNGRTGLMGEAGPEAIMPLKRGKDGKLGVQMSGGSGTVNVTQVFNFSANGDESVKKIIAQAAPQIAMMTQQQIMDSRRRGGSMKATFG
jgi:hypothetical protein